MTHPRADVERREAAVPTEAPESVALAFRLWMGLIALECIHQLINIVVGVMDPADAIEASKKSVERMGMTVTDQQIEVSTYLALVGNGAFALAILAVVAYAAWRFFKKQRFADNMRRMLMFFGIYLGMRALAPFLLEMRPSLPTALLVFDGCLQILVGVAAVMAVILGSKKESVQWSLSANTKQ